MENLPSFLIKIPRDIAVEVTAPKDGIVQYAPGLRTDLGTVVDVLSVAAAGLGGLSTVVVAAGEIRQFIGRLSGTLRRRAVNTVEVAGGGTSEQVEVTDEALLKALRRLLAEQQGPSSGADD